MANDPDRDDRAHGLLPTIHRRRRWLLALAMLTTAAVAVVAYEFFETSPEATAYLLFEPVEPPPLDRELETAAVLITTPDILDAARKDPAVAALPRIKMAPDPHAFLRRRLRVAVVPRTRLVQVSMTLSSAQDAAKVVDAVAKAYRDWAVDRSTLDAEKRLMRLREEADVLEKHLQQRREELKQLAARVGANPPADPFDLDAAKQDLARLDDMRTRVQTELEQANLGTAIGADRVRVIPARPGTRPEFDLRLLVLALGGVFLLVLFLFYLESFFHRGRTADGADSEGPTSSPLAPSGRGVEG
jgi:uncharacterized protein involved in exopolysaccharide biosynthesis